jgi:hypothetical protein
MTFIFVQFSVIVSTALLFLAINGFNDWIIGELQFIPGANWISLPAGLCVLATLLFGAVGAAGILVANLLLYFLRLEFIDLPHAVLSALAQSAGPYLVYLSAERFYGLHASLANLTSKRLLFVIVVCSVICSALPSLVMSAPGDTWNMLIRFLNMFAGNIIGALILVYILKGISAVLP